VRAMLRRLEVEYTAEEIHRYRASHIFEDIVADEVALVFGYQVEARISPARRASKRAEAHAQPPGDYPQTSAAWRSPPYEAEINVVVYTDGGGDRRRSPTDRVKIEAVDKAPDPDIEQAMQPGFSTHRTGVRSWVLGQGWGYRTSGPAPTR